MQPNDPARVDHPTGSVWPGNPPPKASGLVHTYIAKLRRLLEPDAPPRARTRGISLTARGYQLHGDPSREDMPQFRATVGKDGRPLDRGERRRAVVLHGEAVPTWERNGPWD